MQVYGETVKGHTIHCALEHHFYHWCHGPKWCQDICDHNGDFRRNETRCIAQKYTQAHTHTYTYAQIYICMHTYIHTHKHTRTHTHTHIIRTWTYVYTNINITWCDVAYVSFNATNTSIIPACMYTDAMARECVRTSVYQLKNCLGRKQVTFCNIIT